MTARRDIEVRTDRDFTHELALVDGAGDPLDLTGWTFAASIRRKASTATVVADLTVDVDELLGLVTFTLTDAETAELPAGKWVWDVRATSPALGDHTPLEGRATVVQSVTRSA